MGSMASEGVVGSPPFYPSLHGWFWHHRVYSGLGAGIVMESITLIDGAERIRVDPTLVSKRYHVFLSRSLPSALRSIFGQRCPRCRSARIFRSSIYWGFPEMHDRCPT